VASPWLSALRPSGCPNYNEFDGPRHIELQVPLFRASLLRYYEAVKDHRPLYEAVYGFPLQFKFTAALRLYGCPVAQRPVAQWFPRGSTPCYPVAAP
jgi:hypothetical protein